MRIKILLGGGLLIIVVALNFRGVAADQQPGKFDKLSAEDRAALAQRFQKEVWPLLERGGKDGCVGCHNGTKVTTLRFSGKPADDFAMLVGDGFMIKGDPGSILERITDKDPKRVMPPNKLPRWSPDEVKVLRAFVNEVDAKNKL